MPQTRPRTMSAPPRIAWAWAAPSRGRTPRSERPPGRAPATPGAGGGRRPRCFSQTTDSLPRRRSRGQARTVCGHQRIAAQSGRVTVGAAVAESHAARPNALQQTLASRNLRPPAVSSPQVSCLRCATRPTPSPPSPTLRPLTSPASRAGRRQRCAGRRQTRCSPRTEWRSAPRHGHLRSPSRALAPLAQPQERAYHRADRLRTCRLRALGVSCCSRWLR